MQSRIEDEDQTIAAGNDVAAVAQDGEREVVLFLHRERVVGLFGGNGNNLGAVGLQIGQSLLQSANFQIAVGAPLAPIETQYDGAVSKQSPEFDPLPGGIGQLEVRSSCTHCQAISCDAGTIEYRRERFDYPGFALLVMSLSMLVVRCSSLKNELEPGAFGPKFQFIPYRSIPVVLHRSIIGTQ